MTTSVARKSRASRPRWPIDLTPAQAVRRFRLAHPDRLDEATLRRIEQTGVAVALDADDALGSTGSDVVVALLAAEARLPVDDVALILDRPLLAAADCLRRGQALAIERGLLSRPAGR